MGLRTSFRPVFARPLFARATAAAAVLVGALALNTCSGVSFIPLPLPDINTVATQEIRIQVAPYANRDTPIALDVLVIYDEAMLKQVMTLSARDWFARRDQFRRDFPVGYDAWEWELVPGQPVEPQPLSQDALRADATVVFANYLGEGLFRARIDQLTTVLIRLGEKGFTVESVQE